MATNELDGCIQIQFEFLWQTQEQKKIFVPCKAVLGKKKKNEKVKIRKIAH